eukprot:gene66993-biopygen49191
MVLHVGAEAQLREVPGGIEVASGANRVVVDQVLDVGHPAHGGDDLGLETLGVPLDRHGLPTIDPQTQQIGNLPVFLAGDANTHTPLLHEATDEGHIAGMNALATAPTRFRRRTITGTASYATQGRARTAQRNQGRLCVYADHASGRLLGAELCAPDGEHVAKTRTLHRRRDRRDADPRDDGIEAERRRRGYRGHRAHELRPSSSARASI